MDVQQPELENNFLQPMIEAMAICLKDPAQKLDVGSCLAYQSQQTVKEFSRNLKFLVSALNDNLPRSGRFHLFFAQQESVGNSESSISGTLGAHRLLVFVSIERIHLTFSELNGYEDHKISEDFFEPGHIEGIVQVWRDQSGRVMNVPQIAQHSFFKLVNYELKARSKKICGISKF